MITSPQADKWVGSLADEFVSRSGVIRMGADEEDEFGDLRLTYAIIGQGHD